MLEKKLINNFRNGLAIPILIDAAMGFMLISFFVFNVDHPKPEWGKLLQVKPLITTPLAGALCGAFWHFIMGMSKHGLNKIVAIMISIFVSLVGMWLGIVFGLNGTLWN
jgi:hypothetical protein